MAKRDTDIIGRCPICRAELSNLDNFVVCPNDDYKAPFLEWNEIWTAFDADMKNKKDDAEKLLSDLLALNVIANKQNA